MRLEKLKTSLVDSNRWLQRQAEARKTSPQAVDEFKRSHPENPLTLPANFPRLAHAAKSLRIEPLNGSASSLSSGLRISGAALTGIPGAVLTVLEKDGSLTAQLRHGKRRRDIPVSSTSPSFLELKLPSRQVTISRQDGKTEVNSESAAQGFGVSATATAAGLTSLTAYTAKWANLVRMEFVQEKPQSVNIGINEFFASGGSFRNNLYRANSHGFFASSSETFLGRQTPTLTSTFTPQPAPSPQTMFEAAARVMGRLEDSQRQRF